MFLVIHTLAHLNYLIVYQDAKNTITYLQMSADKYEHLTEMEEQVKVLKEKLFAAQTEMTNKDNLVKQHAKVAEEAVSGIISFYMDKLGA